MNIEQAYNRWAKVYDAMQNRTRDLDKQAVEIFFKDKYFYRIIEIGCGTGKNTEYLQHHTNQLIAVDFSQNMLLKAREKIANPNVVFFQADINKDWTFATQQADIITCSLVLEHIENLFPIMQKAANSLNEGGYLFISELHPFKQYMGGQANFDIDGENIQVVAFTHHMSDFINAAGKAGLVLEYMEEYFVEKDSIKEPRLLVLLFRK